MRVPWLCVVLAACASGPAPTPPTAVVDEPQVSPGELYEQALERLNEGKAEEAERLLSEVLQRAPSSVRALSARGMVRERAGNTAGAIADYEGALGADPTHRPTILSLGRVYRASMRDADATALLKRSLEREGLKDDPELLAQLASALRATGDLEGAEAAARKVLAKNPRAPEVHHTLALVALDRGQLKLAEQVAVVAQKLAPKDPAIANTQGLIALRQQDTVRAVAHFERALSLAGDFAPARYNLGAVALAARDYEGARSQLEAAMKAEPKRLQTLVAYAQAVDGLKGQDPSRGKEAGALFEQALELEGEHPEALCGAAWAYATDRSTYDKAIAYFQRCRAVEGTSEQKKAQIDAKVKGLLAMRDAQAPGKVAPPAAPRARASDGGSMIDQVSDSAERAEPPQE